MFAVDGVIVAGAILVLFAVVSSKLSARVGLPLLVVFIAIGMLAGSEGIGRIAFENYPLAHGIGTVALVLILFDGGLRTSVGALQLAWKPAFGLATIGVLITAGVTGLAAAFVLGLPLLHGVLLGAIVGSTDAAAVFSVLRSKGTRLSPRLGATLEVESGSNDPMAVFLTVGLLSVLLGERPLGVGLIGLFLLQMSVGVAAGLVVGYLGGEANRRINLESAGLYPVMMAAVAFFAYGLAASIGGSGFLSVYVAGIVLGNRTVVFKRGILLFQDGMAWLAQIVMFTMLGLLSFPSRLIEVAPQGLAIAAVLIFVARPLAVAPLLFPLGYRGREIMLVAWVGLRGAVPIILALYPLLLGLPEGRLMFNVVFFVVLVSATLQGWTLPRVAERLGLQQVAEPEPPVTLEISSLRGVEGDIVDYIVNNRSKASGRAIREMSLPDGAVVAMVARGSEIIPPRGSTRIFPGDHVFVVLRPEVRGFVDRAFAGRGEVAEPLPAMEFPLSPRTRVEDLVEFYGIAVDAAADSTLEELMRSRLEGGALVVGAAVRLGAVRLSIREMSGSVIERIGLQVMTEEDA
ncbi:MAG TPA: potassium/proton antiporter [Longimicrobiales bacterium]|nr:potassium/proton antiporter [Longimicrobiales bacterium]